MAISILIRLTFLEAVRRKIAIAAFLLGLTFLTLYAIGFHLIETKTLQGQTSPGQMLIRTQVFNFLTTAGLYAVNFLTIAMGALLAADTLDGEISSGTIQTIATKPLRRNEIVLGKWLGFAGLLAVYLVLMAGGVLAIVYFQSGYHLRNIFAGLSLIYLESLLIMTISLACSSMFSALATGGTVFGLYGLALIGGWVEQVGATLRNQTAIDIGIVSSLLIPSEAIWRRANFEMASPLIRSIGFAAGPFAIISAPNILMIVYAVVYLFCMLGLAIRKFNRRDL